LPAIGIGTWGANSVDELSEAILWALKVGYRHIDTAWVYDHAEAAIGVALAKWNEQRRRSLGDGHIQVHVAANKGFANDAVFITTKLWATHMQPDRVLPAVQKSLDRMGVEHIDLLLIHWPIPLVHSGNDGDTNPVGADGKALTDEQVSILDTWRAMEVLVMTGLVHHIGISNATIPLIQQIIDHCRIRPAAVQNEMHPYLQQSDVVDFCHANGIVPIAYSPLGSPGASLPPLSSSTPPAPKLLTDPTLVALAARHSCSTAQIALSWAVQRGTCVIPKSTNLARLEENLRLVELTADDMDAIKQVGEQTRWRCFDPRVLFGCDLFN
ncbi:NADP-dependent oxidoreductase domain-containing protein, partial [Catenaria anguillulae PL171]